MVLALAPQAAAQAPDGRDSTQMIVRVQGGRRNEARKAIRRAGGDILDYHRDGAFFVVQAPDTPRRWAAEVSKDPSVLYSEPDQIVRIADVVPNDPYYADGRLWGLSNIRLPLAWGSQTGSRNVVVGVVDTGVDHTHPDLASQMWVNADEVAGNGIDDDADGFVDNLHGADCAADDGDPMDANSHGTHVAGTIGARGNNGLGVTGVNWDVTIMALRFLGADGSGSTSDAVECIDFATRNGVKISNHSWGGGGDDPILAEAIGRARNAGHLMITAAGNNYGQNNDTSPFYPASYEHDNLIAVAATTPKDELAKFSNYGHQSVDVAAPGRDIYSTIPGAGYAYSSGTSMAAPHVTGVAALALAEHPQATYLGLREALLGGARAVAALETQVASGGIVDAPGALGSVPTSSPATSTGSGRDPSTISARVTRGRLRLWVAGRVRPRHPGDRVVVTLQKMRNGRFVKLATKRPVLSSRSRYATRFARRARGWCRIVATFPRDHDHSRSRVRTGFRC